MRFKKKKNILVLMNKTNIRVCSRIQDMRWWRTAASMDIISSEITVRARANVQIRSMT